MEENKSVRKVNRWIYVLLAFFFGLLGFHRFYAGHIIAGICYLVVFAVGTFLSIIGVGLILLCIEGLVCLYDVIRGLIANPDADGMIVI